MIYVSLGLTKRPVKNVILTTPLGFSAGVSPFDIDVFFRIDAFLRYGTFFVPDVFVLGDNAGMGFSLLFLLNCTFAASVISCYNRKQD